ncbi:104 kDa microneme/rhoptry antigen-like [Argopecten irradians]|uniref:104 kDa microneme/rhoptry antigen-like n=1 Tax=Argopecten irradians TaxID=31199 RepID=UPI00371FBDE2
MAAYVVVRFLDKNRVEVVPKCWLVGRKLCRWPSSKYSSTRLTKDIKKMAAPDDDFKLYEIKVLYETVVYTKAREKRYEADDTTASEPDDGEILHERKRYKRPSTRSLDSSDSEPDSAVKYRKTDNQQKRSRSKMSRLPTDDDQPPLPRSPTEDDQPPLPRSPTEDDQPPLPRSPTDDDQPPLPRSPTDDDQPPLPRSPTEDDQPPLPRSPTDDDQPPLPRSPPPISPSTPRRPSALPASLPATPPQANTPPSSPGSTTLSNADMQELILTLLEQMRDDLVRINKQIQRQQKDDMMDEIELDKLVKELFPIKSFQSMDDVELKLEDEECFRRLLRRLSLIGGTSVRDAVRRLMKLVISNDVAQHCNWIGKGGKTPFSTLKLRILIIRAVRRNVSFENATDDEIENVIKDWLKTATDREGGRRHRENQKSKKMSSKSK